MVKAKDDLDRWIDAACNDGRNPSADGWDRMSEFDDAEARPPLDDAELKAVHDDLTKWRSPADFRRLVDSLHKRCRSREFKSPHRKFLLDAWTLAEFVRHKSVDQVRLAGPSEQWPDGYVRTEGTTENVEVTIALMPGRRMWEEYQFEGPQQCEHDPVEDWVTRADAIPAALEKAIADKVARHYGSRAWLVVYLNISEWGIRQAENELCIAQIKQKHANSFAGIFVIWKEKLL